jgi:Arc/MetJ-type ribon-helix-helix transcriptional regulator
MVELITFKLDEQFLKKVDTVVKEGGYSSRTDLLRDALRDKLATFEKERRLKRMDALLGSKKTKTSDEELHRIRERVFEDLEREYGLK